MISVSSAFKNALLHDNRKYIEKAVITLKDGTVLNLGNGNFWQSGFGIEDAVSPSESSFSALGSAIINVSKLTINNIYDDFSEYDFKGATVVPSVGLLVNDGTDDVEEMLQKGVYTVDEATYNGSLITLKSLDNMTFFDRPYSDSTLVYPASCDTIIRNACTVCGVNLSTSSLNFPHKDTVIDSRPDDEATTFREVISYVATVCGCFARCNRFGDLELKWFDQATLENLAEGYDGGVFDNNTPYETGDTVNGGAFNPWNTGDVANGGVFTDTNGVHYISSLYESQVSVDDVVITGVQIEYEESVDGSAETYTELIGTDDYVIKVSKNPFINGDNIDTIKSRLGTQFIGLKFRKASVTHSSDPTIEAGDVAFIIDRKTNIYPIFITLTNFKVGASQKTVCGASTPNRNSATRYSQQTKSFVTLRKEMKAQKTAYDQALEDLSDRIDNAGGLYETQISQAGGGVITYMHNKPLLAESDIQIMISDVGVTVTANGTAQTPTWYGLTVDGQLIASILNTVGINADWINTGQLVISKDGSEVFFADVDTGTVRISGASISITAGDSLDTAITQRVEEAVEVVAADGRNILYDTNAPTVYPVAPNGGLRLIYNLSTISTNATGTEWTEIPSPPIDDIKYGMKHVCTNASSSGKEHWLMFYYGGSGAEPEVKYGRTYTVSFWAKTEVDNAQVGVYISNSSYWDQADDTILETINIADGWKKISVTFKAMKDTYGTYGSRFFSLYLGFAHNVVGTVYCCGYQLEEGDIVTEWSEHRYVLETYGGINLLRNTKDIDITDANTLPNINGYVDSSIVHSTGALTATEHGVKITSTSAVCPYLIFGTDSASTGGLYGLIAGETYTFSFDLETKIYSNYTSGNGYLDATLQTDVLNEHSSGTLNTWNFNKVDYILVNSSSENGTVKSRHVSFTFTIPKNATRLRLRVHPGNTTNSRFKSGDYIELKNMKLERGNKSTDWTAAPEDIDKSIATATVEYGTCATASGTAAKVVVASGFELKTGSQIAVKFTNSNTATAPTLNVNSTGAKAIYAKNAVIEAKYFWTAGSIVRFSYDGTNWVMDAEDQEEIFKRLTNNGEVQGLYLSNGKLYLNATYIQTGTLNANLITTGKIQSADGSVYFDLTNNVLACNTMVGYNSHFVINQVAINQAYYAYSTYFRYSAATGINLIPPRSSDETAGITCVNGLMIESCSAANHRSGNGTELVVDGDASDNIRMQADPNHYIVVRKPATTSSAAMNFQCYQNGMRIDASSVAVYGTFSVAGTKSRIVDTDDYGERKLYCYETASPIFGDVGEGVIAEDGLCYVYIDAVFAETVALNDYQAFLQRYGEGDCYVIERKSGYFVVKGTVGLKFGWEIKAKQADYTQLRLDETSIGKTPLPIDEYATELEQHILDIQTQREEVLNV